MDTDGTGLDSTASADVSGPSTNQRHRKSRLRSVGDSWLVSAADIEPRRVEWLWDHRWPIGAVTIVAGIGGMGKSQIAIDKIAALSRGELEGPPANTLLITAEDTAAEVVVPRLIVSNAVRERVTLLELGRDLSLPRDLENGKLRELVEQSACKLLVLDPLMAFIDSNHIDTHKVSDVRHMLANITAIANARNVAVVAILHFHKGENSNIIHQFSGSAGFGDAARSAFVTGINPTWDGPDEGAPQVFLHVKSNWGRKQPPDKFHVEECLLPSTDPGDLRPIVTSRVAWDGPDSDIRVDEVFRKKRDSGPREERLAAQRFLEDILAKGPVPSKEVLDAASANAISLATLKRARQDLGVEAFRAQGEAGKISEWLLRLTQPEVVQEV